MRRRQLSESPEGLDLRASWWRDGARGRLGGWYVSLPVVDPIPGFPVTDCVAREHPATPAYRIVNRDRCDEHFSLLKITLAGEGRFRDGAGEHRIPPGHAFVCRSDDPATSYYYPPDGRVPWDVLWLQFSGDAAQPLLRALIARYGPVFSLGLGHSLIRRLLAYGQGQGQRRTTVSLQTPTEALLLIASALEALAASARRYQTSANDIVERAIAVIEQRLADGIAVAGVADAVAVSREHLSRQFAARLGCSVQSYLRRERVRQACLLLRGSDLPLKTVARRCGLSSPELLIRAFAAELGTTPGKYRKTLS